MKIWSTGESSFITRNYVRYSKKHEVVNRLGVGKYDSYRTYNSGYEGYENEIDIFNPALLDLVSESGAEMIFHNAAVVGTDYCTANPELAIKTNIDGTLAIVQIAKKLNIPLVFVSTSVCYEPTPQVIKEDFKLNPQTIYGYTKWAGEELLRVWMKKNYVSIVPAMLFGAYDLHSATNKLIMSGYGKKNGTQHILLNPELYKPFMYVDNYMAGVDCIIDNFESLDTQRINIAPHDNKPFGYVVDYVTKTLGLNPDFELHPDKDYLGGHVLDDSKLQKFGWRQTILLEEGINRVADLVKNGNMFDRK